MQRGLPIYIEDRIPLRSLHMFLVALSILHGVSKYTVSGDWYICPVDLVASLCVQYRTDQLLEWSFCEVMHAFHESCIEYLWILSGRCAVRLGWVLEG